jgi:hypothetical protein
MPGRSVTKILRTYKTAHREIIWAGMDWINVARNRDKWVLL